VSESAGNRVRQLVLSTGAVTTLAGSGTAASTDGTGISAAFHTPFYVALDGVGNMFVADIDGHRIRKVVSATQAVTTVAGSGTAAFADGVGPAASFNSPHGISCDANGNAYVADGGNNRIRKIVLSTANVTTLAGSATPSTTNGVGTAAGFSRPVCVVVDSSGTLLFVAESTNNRVIRQIVIATQTVTTLAGSGASGSANGIGVAAQFVNPHGLAVDSSGNLFVGDTGSQLIRKIVIATQTVTTIAGTGAAAWVDGFGTNAAFSNPIGLAVDARGNVLVAESGNQRVRVMQPTVPCPAGVYCAPGTSTTAVPCTPGYYCAAGSDRVLCPTAAYCPEGSATPISCPLDNFYCPIGSAAPIAIPACPVGCEVQEHCSVHGMIQFRYI
jgi:serine/threonine-protein kinase